MRKELRVRIPADLHDWLSDSFPNRGQNGLVVEHLLELLRNSCTEQVQAAILVAPSRLSLGYEGKPVSNPSQENHVLRKEAT